MAHNLKSSSISACSTYKLWMSHGPEQSNPRGGGGRVILGEVKARPKDIISFSLDYISKSKVQTSNPPSSPIPLDTPARPADSNCILWVTVSTCRYVRSTLQYVRSTGCPRSVHGPLTFEKTWKEEWCCDFSEFLSR